VCEVTVIREIENGKRKADTCEEFGLINSMMQIICKNSKNYQCVQIERIENKVILKA
jgi:hypothetical protein